MKPHILKWSHFLLILITGMKHFLEKKEDFLDGDGKNFTNKPSISLQQFLNRFSSTSQVTSDVLRFVTKPIIENRECSTRYPLLFRSDQICAGSSNGAGGCLGDTGRV